MNPRRLVLALLLAPILFFGFLAFREQAGNEHVLPRFDKAQVARIELSHGEQNLVLARQGPQKWLIPSAADAPADSARIEAALDRLAALEGKPAGDPAPASGPKREPVIVRLLDAKGSALAEAAFWTHEAHALPDGPRLSVSKPPALPLWPSAWSSQKAPQIDAAKVLKAERLTAAGPVALSDAEAAKVAAILGRLSATDFVSGGSVDWAGARMVRVTLVDGTAVDLAQVPDGEGRYHLRLASDTHADVRASRKLAFRVSEVLP